DWAYSVLLLRALLRALLKAKIHGASTKRPTKKAVPKPKYKNFLLRLGAQKGGTIRKSKAVIAA
ncbi:MAG: hypothetical protein WCD57_13345, partial [Acidobacteriaceae bacterium]